MILISRAHGPASIHDISAVELENASAALAQIAGALCRAIAGSSRGPFYAAAWAEAFARGVQWGDLGGAVSVSFWLRALGEVVR